jgi:hypothetical protein
MANIGEPQRIIEVPEPVPVPVQIPVPEKERETIPERVPA